MGELDGKVAIVTGGGNGIGRATSWVLAREGAAIVVADINPEFGKRTVKEVEEKGGKALFVETDVANEASVKNMIETAKNHFERIDILASVAGIGYDTGSLDNPEHALIENMTETEWDRTLAINLKGYFFCTKYVAPIMKKQKYGKIVCVSSRAGRQGQGGGTGGSGPAYGASKAGLINLTKTLGRQLGPYGIHVNCVAPGTVIDSPNTGITTQFTMTEKGKQEDLKVIPLRRLGYPEDVAEAILFLCSDKRARFIHGITLDVDGGRGMW